MLAVVLALAVVGTGACSKDDDASAADGGTDGAVDLAREGLPYDQYVRDWVGVCDPGLQNCAAPTDECTLDCMANAFACTAGTGGTARHGETCMVGTCEKGSTCVGDPAGGPAKCRKWCRLDSDCPGGRPCSLVGIQCPGAPAAMGWLCSP